MAHILVVDDDPSITSAICAWLESRGNEITTADGGAAGLQALGTAMIDIMIIDIFMPHMRGFESIRVFRQHAPSVPLIAISGYAFAELSMPAPDFLKMALDLGATRCLRKPLTPGILLAAVELCLAEVTNPRRSLFAH